LHFQHHSSQFKLVLKHKNKNKNKTSKFDAKNKNKNYDGLNMCLFENWVSIGWETNCST
jgi:hypothetical protein